MQTSAKLSGARISAQKARLVVDQIRGLRADKALNVLEFSLKKGAVIIKKLLLSALANAENNHGLDIDDLSVKTIFVDEAPRLKRFSPRAKGRANRITKQNCHISIVVSDGQD